MKATITLILTIDDLDFFSEEELEKFRNSGKEDKRKVLIEKTETALAIPVGTLPDVVEYVVTNITEP